MKKIITTLTLTLALIGQNLQGAENYKTLVVNATTRAKHLDIVTMHVELIHQVLQSRI